MLIENLSNLKIHACGLISLRVNAMHCCLWISDDLQVIVHPMLALPQWQQDRLSLPKERETISLLSFTYRNNSYQPLTEKLYQCYKQRMDKISSLSITQAIKQILVQRWNNINELIKLNKTHCYDNTNINFNVVNDEMGGGSNINSNINNDSSLLNSSLLTSIMRQIIKPLIVTIQTELGRQVKLFFGDKEAWKLASIKQYKYEIIFHIDEWEEIYTHLMGTVSDRGIKKQLTMKDLIYLMEWKRIFGGELVLQTRSELSVTNGHLKVKPSPQSNTQNTQNQNNKQQNEKEKEKKPRQGNLF